MSPQSAGVTIQWHRYPGPRDYRPDVVPRALEAVATATFSSAREAASNLRFAVGNDHAGSLYPAAVPAARVVVGCLSTGAEAARWAALDVLLDWCSFGPEPGFETFVDPDSGKLVDLMSELRRAVANASEALKRIATSAEAGEASGAKDILDWVHGTG